MEIREYITPLLKWWWLILLSTLIAAGSSYLASQRQQLVYESSTTLIIGNFIDDPNPSNNELFLSQQLAATYVDLANRASVREATMEALGTKWLPAIRVTQPNNSNIIEIIVRAPSPEVAQAVAAELANQLILRSPTATQANDQERQDFINNQLDDYETAITETQAQIVEKNDQLVDLISAREIADMESEIDLLEASLQRLQTNYALLLQSTEKGALNSVSILEPASLPKQPIDTRKNITILTAAGIGFVLAVSAAYILEYLDDTVKTPEQLLTLTKQPTMVSIGRIKSKENSLVTVAEPRSSISEAFRVMRTGIQFASLDNPLKSVLVTSAMAAEGKSTISANLAVVLAQAGHQVLIIDSDLRSPSQHDIFGLDNHSGLTNLLLFFDKANKADRLQQLFEKTIHKTTIQGLNILTSGSLPPNPSELLGSVTMKGLLKNLFQVYDYIIFDAPPALAVTDAAILSTHVTSTLLVVRAGKSRKKYVEHAVQRLRDVNANLIGCVLNSVSKRDSMYGGYFSYPIIHKEMIAEEAQHSVVAGDNQAQKNKKIFANLIR